MKNVLWLTMLLVASTSIHAQTAVAQTGTAQAGTASAGVAGTWRFGDGQNSWTATLNAEGPKLTGTVTSCASNRGAIDILEGQVNGNAITFKCKSLNGARTLTFTGKVSGDEIALTWEQAGAGGNGADTFIFGESAPKQFTLNRIRAVMWTGTVQNVNDQGVVNNQKSPASIEVKQVRDPHWRWRDVGDLTVATIVVGGNGGGTYELNSFATSDKELSFKFSRPVDDEPGRDDVAQCVLPRRADGAYEGTCNGGGFRRHVTLTPPAPAESK